MWSGDNNNGFGVGQATFNQAGFQMFRLHQIMSQINLCWLNLTGETEDTPNHLVLFNCLVAFYLEVKPSFTSTEQEPINNELEVLELLITTNTLFTFDDDYSMSGKTNKRKLNLGFYHVLRKSLRNFQSMILEVAGKHGLLNPEKSDPRKSIIQM